MDQHHKHVSWQDFYFKALKHQKLFSPFQFCFKSNPVGACLSLFYITWSNNRQTIKSIVKLKIFSHLIGHSQWTGNQRLHVRWQMLRSSNRILRSRWCWSWRRIRRCSLVYRHLAPRLWRVTIMTHDTVSLPRWHWGYLWSSISILDMWRGSWCYTKCTSSMVAMTTLTTMTTMTACLIVVYPGYCKFQNVAIWIKILRYCVFWHLVGASIGL